MIDAVKFIIFIIIIIIMIFYFFYFFIFNVITLNFIHFIKASCVMVTPLQDYKFLNKGWTRIKERLSKQCLTRFIWLSSDIQEATVAVTWSLKVLVSSITPRSLAASTGVSCFPKFDKLSGHLRTATDWLGASSCRGLRNGPDKNDSNNGNEHVGMQKGC